MNWWRKFRRLNPPVQWLVGFITLILVLAFLFAPEPKPVNFKEISFSTTSDSRLYFQNIRSFYYQIDAFSKKPMIIYSLKRRTLQQDSGSLQFSIIRHPHSNAAYAYAEPGPDFQQYDSLYVTFRAYKQEPLWQINSETHYRIAAKVYSSLLNEQAIFILSGNDTLKQLYTDRQTSLNARVTLEDYFKLTNKN